MVKGNQVSLCTHIKRLKLRPSDVVSVQANTPGDTVELEVKLPDGKLDFSMTAHGCPVIDLNLLCRADSLLQHETHSASC